MKNNLTHSDPSIWLQPVAKLAKQPGTSAIWHHPIAKLTPDLAQVVRDFVSVVPWGHRVLMLCRLKSTAEHFWYLRATARFGWSLNGLLNQIRGDSLSNAPSTPA